MNWRTAGPIVAALGVVCLALVLSAVYPLSYAEHDASVPGDGAAYLDSTDEFRVTATLTTDGERTIAMEGAVASDGPRFHRFVDQQVHSEQYQPSPDADVYSLWTGLRESQAERLRDSIERDPDRRLLDEERIDGEVRLRAVENASSDRADDVRGSASVFRNAMRVPEYGLVSETTDGRVYEPRGGWFEGTEPFRVTDAHGRVVVDPDVGGVRSADVSWTLTERAPTYAHYLVRAGIDQRLRYDVDLDPQAVEEPAWVAELRSDR